MSDPGVKYRLDKAVGLLEASSPSNSWPNPAVRRCAGPVVSWAPATAPPGKRITLWFEDEARIGQKGRVCHRWWSRGERPPGLCDQRYTWVHLFGAVQPATGRRFALVMPVVSTKAMSLFLDGVSQQLAADEHAVMVIDQAGWHGAHRLRAPGNITLVPRPSYSPELNPVERLWLYLRDDTCRFVCSMITMPSSTNAVRLGTNSRRNAS
jgi:hypothetical protein